MEDLFYRLANLSGNATYFILFGILVACGLGFPLPEDIPLIATGYLCWDGTLHVVPAVIVMMIGVLLGDTLLYLIGLKLGLRFLNSPKVATFFKPKKVKRTRAYFRKYGDKIVFFARFVAGIRGIVFFMAGAMKMRYRRFILLDAVAAVLSVPIWIALGYLLGRYFGDDIERGFKKFEFLKRGITFLILAAAVYFVVNAYIQYRKAQKPKTK